MKKKIKSQNNFTSTSSQIATAHPSELRQDLVSGDWVVIATGRAKRPDLFKQSRQKVVVPKSKCPFEDLRKAGNAEPLLIYKKKNSRDWFVQVVPNKYPAFFYGACPDIEKIGPFERMDGIGFHEVFVTRDHERHIPKLSPEEVELLVRAYQERYAAIKNDPCVRYILIFHNYGAEAGASVPHPHSQLVALPVVPPDVANSIRGSKEYWRKHRRCVHCEMLAWELKEKSRIIAMNRDFVALCPFASRRAFEVRIFPKKHEPSFEFMSQKSRMEFGKILKESLQRLYKGLDDPAYNFFIHTAPSALGDPRHYHWHVEILPITSAWGGVEFGTGIEISTITPESAAEYLLDIRLK